MPDLDQATAAIFGRLDSEFSAHPIAWPNSAFEPPVDGSGNPLPYIRPVVLGGEARTVSVGVQRNFRHPGALKIAVLVPVGEGDGRARRISRDLEAIFRGVTVTAGVRFLAPYTTIVGPDGAYWQASVTCPFQYDLTA